MIRFEVRTGDCLAVMRTLDDSSVDSIVTDPPYELGFMGKSWDASGVAFRVEVWREALRVLKPGGHLLAFSGSRTYHRMAVAIEDAGFEIRDQIMWVYGSGFPKSLDVSKAIDKRGGNSHLTAEIGAALKAARKARGMSISEADRTYCGGVTLWSWYEGRPAGQQMPTAEALHRIAFDWPELQPYADATSEAERERLSQVNGSRLAVAPGQDNDRSATTLDITAPATPAAQQWAGWGTALKPAHEPIVVARKPLIGTVAANVLAHGTGAINIDGCRVGTGGDKGIWPITQRRHADVCYTLQSKETDNSVGRWPANLIHDGSEEVEGFFPGDDGASAARFFYSAKASKRDRDEGLEHMTAQAAGGLQGRHDGSLGSITMRANIHPTVKPTDLMRYLCRLVTPPGGLVLDPFTGSGSTGKGAVIEGFRFLGIELSPEYTEIARARIRHAVGHVAPEPVTEDQVPDALPGQLRLFA